MTDFPSIWAGSTRVFQPRFRALNFAVRAIAQGWPTGVAVWKATPHFGGRPGPRGGHPAPAVPMLSW